MNQIVYNINKKAAVVLTDHGAEILNKTIYEERKQLIEVYPEVRKKIKHPKIYRSGDVYIEQLWRVMQIFGSHLYNGAQNSFENCQITLNVETSQITLNDN